MVPADEVTLGVGIDADTGSATKDMHAVADAVSVLSEAMRDLTSSIKPLATQLDKVERGAAGVAKTQKSAAEATSSTTNAIKEQATAAAALNKTLQQNKGNIYTGNDGQTKVSTSSTVSRPDIGVVSKQDIESQRASNYAREQAVKLINAERQAILDKVKANAAENRAFIAANDRRITNPFKETGVGESAKDVAARMQGYVYATNNASNATGQLRDNLFTARYALHDISNATTIAGAALVGFNAYAIKAAADYETALAAIDRTTGATASQMQQIRNDFVALAQSVPAGFENIAQIGELAGQLNIPAGQIASFTETVAQFTSSTDVSVQSSAEAFGRLDTLLPDVRGNYEALGSSILNVGVNSVATESQIISTTTQIAAAGAQARFTADEVIGLASSFASLGVAPEAARGSTIRIFSELRQAALEGGDGLAEFARISGQSADEFKNQWLQGDASQAFLDFLQGLQTEGANAETTLRNLGITGVRDINALLRLSQNLDIVTQSFSYANDGLSQGTQLAEAYGITSETLNSRVQVLGQAFQAFFADLGAGSTGPLKQFVNLLIDVLKTMTELARNPAAQWLAIFGAVFTLLAGGALIITGLVTRMGAAAIAMRTVNTELREMAGQATASGAAMTGLQGKLVGAGIAATTFGNVLRGIGWATAITAGLTIATIAVTAFVDSLKSDADRAKEAFGDFSGLTSALQKDTQEVADGTQNAIGTVAGVLTTTTSATAGWVSELENATGAQTTLAGEVDRTKQSVDDFTYSIGQNTAAWIANQLANNEAVVELFKQIEKAKQAGAQVPDASGIISAAIRNDTAEAQRLIDDFKRRVQEAGQGTGFDVKITTDLQDTLGLVTAALGEAAAKGQITETVMTGLGFAANGASDDMSDLGEEALTTADKLGALQQSVQDAFSVQNTVGDFGAAVRDLFQGLADGAIYGADAFNVLGSVGKGNMDNLQNAIVATISAGATLGVSAVDSVSALFIELQRQGIDTANLLASIASIPGIGANGAAQVKAAVSGQRQLSGASTQLSNAMRGLSQVAPKAAKGVSKTGGAAKKAAQEVRTLVDYAGDLGKVFDRAFEIRFGSAQGTDKITSDYIKMQEAIDEANKSIAETNRRLNELSVDNDILAYFQKVAIDYGDTLRAADIGSDIAKNNAEMAEQQQKAADAAGTLNKDLTGNSKAALENRDAITTLVGNYQELIKSYASAGLDQDALKTKTGELKDQFYDQGQKLGFSRDQLDKYALAFDDVTLAISRVPRNITVAANTNPALQALNEFIAGAQGREARVNVGSGGNDYNNGYSAGRSYGEGWALAVSKSRRIVETAANVPGGKAYQMVNEFGGAIGPKFFAKGGYTGNMPTNAQAGIVHGQEFVVNAENTSRLGLGFLNAINSGKTPVSQPSSGIMVVELSAQDRALLAAAGNVQLVIPGQAIAGATNGANFVSAKRGSS